MASRRSADAHAMGYNDGGMHEILDRISAALAGEVARGLPGHPEWIDLARENIERWSRQNAGSPSLVRCYEEWGAILDRPVGEVVAILMGHSQGDVRLRQNSPFAGALSPASVWTIKRRIRDESRAA